MKKNWKSFMRSGRFLQNKREPVDGHCNMPLVNWFLILDKVAGSFMSVPEVF